MLLFSFGILAAQDSPETQRQYLNGKELFKLGKYELAMEAFKPLTSTSKNSMYSEYASFYYALSAYRVGQLDLAKSMLLQIEQRFPRWNKIQDVYYWISKVNFEGGDYLPAIAYNTQIKNEAIKTDGLSMKKAYLSEVQDQDLLQELIELHPYDKEVAEALAVRIASQPIINQDRNLLDFLISEFELNDSIFAGSQHLRSIKKESYNVAVMLPILYDRVKSSRSVRNNPFLDLYEGIAWGQKQLKSEGVNINLFAYDTRMDSLATQKLMSSEEMLGMDLIIGPLHGRTSPLASNFSFENRVNMINPLSSNSTVIGNNPFSFLFKPSLETQARRAANFAKENFDDKKAAIVYGISVQDSIKAYNYKVEMEKDSFEVVLMKKVDAKDLDKMVEWFSGDYPLKEIKKIGHFYLPSEDRLLNARMITVLESYTSKPAIVSEEWLKISSITFEELEQLGVYFVAPDFVKYGSHKVSSFRESFQNQENIYPSKYVYLGYEMMLYVGRMLEQHGTYFQTSFSDNKPYRGEIFIGTQFKQSNDNQVVPILKFQESDLVLANDPFQLN